MQRSGVLPLPPEDLPGRSEGTGTERSNADEKEQSCDVRNNVQGDGGKHPRRRPPKELRTRSDIYPSGFLGSGGSVVGSSL